MQMHKHARILAALIAVVAFVTVLLAPGYALAEEGDDDVPTVTLDYGGLDGSELENPVADNVTRVLVDKLAADTHEYVEGAHLVIYRQDDASKTPVAEWVSTSSAHEIAKVLDINTPYVLHEVSVPEGYGLAQDVVFELYSENFNTTGRIISGGDNGNAEFQLISGSGSNQAFVIALYDPVKPAEEKKENHKQREVERTRERLAQTSDLFNQPLVIGLCAGGIVAIAIGVRKARKDK